MRSRPGHSAVAQAEVRSVDYRGRSMMRWRVALLAVALVGVGACSGATTGSTAATPSVPAVTTVIQEVTIGAASCVDIEVGPLEDLLDIDDATFPIDLEARVPALFLCSSLLAPREGVSLGFAAYPVTSVDDLMGGFEAMCSA